MLDSPVAEPVTQLEIDLFFMLLTVAGNETTRNLISHGLLALLDPSGRNGGQTEPAGEKSRPGS